MNGSRPPPSYANTSRRGKAPAPRAHRCRALSVAEPHESRPRRDYSRTCASGRPPAARWRPPIHERADRKTRPGAARQRIGEQLLRGREPSTTRLLRHDDARQRRMSASIRRSGRKAEDLESVAIRSNGDRLLGVSAESWRCDPAYFRLRRDVIDQRRTSLRSGTSRRISSASPGTLPRGAQSSMLPLARSALAAQHLLELSIPIVRANVTMRACGFFVQKKYPRPGPRRRQQHDLAACRR